MGTYITTGPPPGATRLLACLPIDAALCGETASSLHDNHGAALDPIVDVPYIHQDTASYRAAAEEPTSLHRPGGPVESVWTVSSTEGISPRAHPVPPCKPLEDAAGSSPLSEGV